MALALIRSIFESSQSSNKYCRDVAILKYQEEFGRNNKNREMLDLMRRGGCDDEGVRNLVIRHDVGTKSWARVEMLGVPGWEITDFSMPVSESHDVLEPGAHDKKQTIPNMIYHEPYFSYLGSVILRVLFFLNLVMGLIQCVVLLPSRLANLNETRIEGDGLIIGATYLIEGCLLMLSSFLILPCCM